MFLFSQPKTAHTATSGWVRLRSNLGRFRSLEGRPHQPTADGPDPGPRGDFLTGEMDSRLDKAINKSNGDPRKDGALGSVNSHDRSLQRANGASQEESAVPLRFLPPI